MPRDEAQKNAPAFVAYVYEEDYKAIQRLVQQYPNIETGGDLFGLWKDEKTVVIQQYIGPGKNCERTTTSFHQDIEYLHKVGSLITTKEGLCNVGEWHSHHQIGMPEPSGADRRTVFSNMPQLGLERFVLFIASIEGKGSSGKKRSHDVKLEDIKLRPFLFLGSTQDIVKGKIEIIPGSNPHRRNSRARNEIEDGAEKASERVKRTSTSSEENYGSAPKQPERKGKGRGKPTQGGTTTKDKPETHQQQGKGQDAKEKSADNSARQQQGEQIHSNKYDESVRGKPRDDQQPAQIEDGINNENRSPNSRSSAPNDHDFKSLPTSLPSDTTAAPSDRDFKSLPTSLPSDTTRAWGPDTRANVPQTTSAPSSLWQVWDASLHPGAAQGQNRDLQENVSMLTDHPTPQSLQPSSAPLQVGAAPHFGEAQGRVYDTHRQRKFLPQSHSSSSQQFSTQPLQSQTRSRTREPQRNMPPIGDTYPNPQSPQHSSYTQQTSQRSARDQGYGQGNMQPTGGAYSRPQNQQHSRYTQHTSERSARGQGYGQGNMPHQPYTAQGTSQAQAKHRDGSIPIGKINAKGSF